MWASIGVYMYVLEDRFTCSRRVISADATFGLKAARMRDAFVRQSVNV